MGEMSALIDLLLERSGKPIAKHVPVFEVVAIDRKTRCNEAIFYFLSQAFNCRDCAKYTARPAKVFLVRDPLIYNIPIKYPMAKEAFISID